MKKKSKTSNLIILIPLILVISLDLIFTIVGQPKEYWQNYSSFSEQNPVGQLLLSSNPLFFIIISIIYLFLVLFLVIKIPRPINIMLYIGFFLGHAWGGASWSSEILNNFFSIKLNEFYSSIIYFILIAIISGLCLKRISERSFLL